MLLLVKIELLVQYYKIERVTYRRIFTAVLENIADTRQIINQNMDIHRKISETITGPKFKMNL